MSYCLVRCPIRTNLCKSVARIRMRVMNFNEPNMDTLSLWTNDHYHMMYKWWMVKFGKQNQPNRWSLWHVRAIVYHPCAPLFNLDMVKPRRCKEWLQKFTCQCQFVLWLLAVCLWSLRLAKLSLVLVVSKNDRYDVQPELFKIMVRHCEGHVHNYWDVWQMVFDANLAPTFPNLAGHCAAKIIHLWLCQVLSCITTGAPCGSHQLWPCGKYLYSASWYSSPANCLASAWFRRAMLAEKNMQVLPLVFSADS